MKMRYIFNQFHAKKINLHIFCVDQFHENKHFQVDSKPTVAGEIPSLDVRVQNPTGRFGGDGKNIAVLLFLYVLQGIPLGLAAAVPLILTNKHVSYR